MGTRQEQDTDGTPQPCGQLPYIGEQEDTQTFAVKETGNEEERRTGVRIKRYICERGLGRQ